MLAEQQAGTILSGTVKERCILYARVSKDDKGKGDKLDDQIKLCREYAIKQGYNIIAELPEDDRRTSGADEDLPQLTKLRDMAQTGQFDVLIVREMDRLSRGMAKQFIIEKELKKAGIKISYVLTSYEDSPEGRINKNIRAVIAEYEREKIRERVIRGKRNKVLRGSTLAFGHAPYGYQEIANGNGFEFEIVESEAEIIRELYHLYAIENLSLAEIGRQLREKRVPTYSDLRGNHFRRSKSETHIKARWFGSTVCQILKNPVYKGQWFYGKTKMTEQGKIKNVDTNMSVTVPSIVSEDVWDLAQEKLSHNKKNRAGRRTKYEILMARRVTCACGLKMASTVKQNGRYKYLRCPGSLSKGEVQRDACPKPYLKAELVDNLAWEWLYKILSDKKELKNRIDNYIVEQEKIAKPLREKLETIDSLLEQRENEHKAMALSFHLLPELAQAKVIEGMESLEHEIKSLQAEKNHTLEELEKIQDMMADIQLFVIASDNGNLNVAIKDNTDYLAAIETNKIYLSKQIFSNPNRDFGEIRNLLDDNTELTFQEKLDYMERFDVQGQLVIENGQELLHVQCKLGLDALLELSETFYAVTQFKQHYFMLSDLLTLKQLQSA